MYYHPKFTIITVMLLQLPLTIQTKMFPLKWLYNLLAMENLLGVYRNYYNQEIIKKYLIIFHIFVQTILHGSLVIYAVYLMLGRHDINQMKLVFSCFSVVTFINSVASVLTGICSSRAFISYLRSINRISSSFKENAKVVNSLKKIFYSGIFLIFFSFVFSAVRCTEALILFAPSDHLVFLIPVMVSQIVIRMIVVLQYLILCVVIMTVVHSTKCLSWAISGARENVGKNRINSDEQSVITREQIHGWVEVYRDLMNCCDKASCCFGRQYFYSLVLSVSQYILATYQIFYTFVLNIYPHGAERIAIVLFSYIAVMLIPLIAGQMTKNQGEKFYRVLVRLYNKTIIDAGEAESKLIKDFIRLIKKHPLEIKLVSKFAIGMYMLPIILTLAVNYVIVMLQFNHVI